MIINIIVVIIILVGIVIIIVVVIIIIIITIITPAASVRTCKGEGFGERGRRRGTRFEARTSKP